MYSHEHTFVIHTHIQRGERGRRREREKISFLENVNALDHGVENTTVVKMNKSGSE